MCSTPQTSCMFMISLTYASNRTRNHTHPHTYAQVDETSNLLVTFGLHGKDILINDMRVSGNGVAIACECISQASSSSRTFFSRAFSIPCIFRWVCALCSLVGIESLAVAAAGPLSMLSATLPCYTLMLLALLVGSAVPRTSLLTLAFNFAFYLSGQGVF